MGDVLLSGEPSELDYAEEIMAVADRVPDYLFAATAPVSVDPSVVVHELVGP